MSNPKLTRICPNGIIQQGNTTIAELNLDVNTITECSKIGRGDKPTVQIKITTNKGYYFIKYQDLALLEKEFQEVKNLTNGN